MGHLLFPLGGGGKYYGKELTTRRIYEETTYPSNDYSLFT